MQELSLNYSFEPLSENEQRSIDGGFDFLETIIDIAAGFVGKAAGRKIGAAIGGTVGGPIGAVVGAVVGVAIAEVVIHVTGFR